MIQVTRLNDSVLVINAENIQSVEANPDTVITFVNRDRLLVKEPVAEVSQRILHYRRVLLVSTDPAGHASTGAPTPAPAA